MLRSAVEAAAGFSGAVVATTGGHEIPRFALSPPTIQTQGTIAAMALYAGESVDHVKRIQSAAEITADLTANIE